MRADERGSSAAAVIIFARVLRSLGVLRMGQCRIVRGPAAIARASSGGSDAGTTTLDGDPTRSGEDSVPIDLAAGGVDSLLPEFKSGFGSAKNVVFIPSSTESSTRARRCWRSRTSASSTRSPCTHCSDTPTNDVFSVFYRVRDRFLSFMDTTNIVSLRYEKHLREGKFKSDRVVVFDQKQHKAFYEDREVSDHPAGRRRLSAMYYARTLPLEGGALGRAGQSHGREELSARRRSTGAERVSGRGGVFRLPRGRALSPVPGDFRRRAG